MQPSVHRVLFTLVIQIKEALVSRTASVLTDMLGIRAMEYRALVSNSSFQNRAIFT